VYLLVTRLGPVEDRKWLLFGEIFCGIFLASNGLLFNSDGAIFLLHIY